MIKMSDTDRAEYTREGAGLNAPRPAARTQKPPEGPPTEAWIKKAWHTPTAERHSAVRKNATMPPAAASVDLEVGMPEEVRKRKTDTRRYRSQVGSKAGHERACL